MTNKKIIFSVFLVLLISIFVFSTSKSKIDNIGQKGTAQYFPAKTDFCGEQTPLDIVDVRERFDRELLINANMHSSTLLIIKRANRAFPVIEPILKKYEIPDDFKYLAVIESALLNATSPAGAKGIWQFMPETAREKGLEVSETVDERYHLEKSTEAACKYLLNAKSKFGSWTLAAASYNGGMQGISKQTEFQKVDNYYDLLLVEETSRYVFRILALKEIMKAPKDFGFDIQNADLYSAINTKKIEIDSTINDLAVFAKAQNINYKTLKFHNPWLRDKKLSNPTRKKYTLELPNN
ncbi:MAG: hypothetical protein RLZZ312_338 [Bacteroidota bacterium]|jgi:hypothetical protein